MTFSPSTTAHLGHYVYGLVDPRDDHIFYVGKASANNRAFSHLRVRSGESAKGRRITEIRAAGLEPVVEVLRYGFSSASECFEVEAAVIDAIGIENLTNTVRGHGVDRGRQTAHAVERLHGSEPVAVEMLTEPFMLFFIHQTYSPTKSEVELYDSIRQFWYGVAAATRAPDENGHLPYPVALGMVDSVAIRAYSVAAWFPAGTTFSTRQNDDPENRWEFVGQMLPDHALVGRRLTCDGVDLSANQIGYGYLN